MVVRWLQQKRASEAILSALMQRWGVSRRQAYRYLLQAQRHSELRPVPQPKAVFTVNLPQLLIQAVRARCRKQRRAISQVVAEILEQWVNQTSPHG